MSRKAAICRKANGLFMRNLGWKAKESGYSQHKFYLGRDEYSAKATSLRLEQLWEHVEKRWRRENRLALNPTDRPVWDEVTLSIAEAVRNEQNVAKIPLPLPLSALIPESPLIALWLDELRSDVPLIRIEILDAEADSKTEEVTKREGQRLIEMGRKMILRKIGGETLHAALDAYLKWIDSKYLTVDKKRTLWGGTQSRQVRFIRDHLPKTPLAEMGAHQIEEFIDVLRLRPIGEKGVPVSVTWTRNCIKQFRHFLRWLNKSSLFAWKRPADLELPQIRIPLSDTEAARLSRPIQVQTYSIDEIGTLWTHATPFQRLLMLLALNCGFGRSEVASLETAEILLKQKHPHEREIGITTSDEDSWIMRLRRKTGVYGEWKLWPETVLAIEWFLRQRSAMSVLPGVTTLLVTKKGHRYDAVTEGNHPNVQIPNSWHSLTARIRKDNSDFRSLSFNKLRKTAATFIRDAHDGEIAGIFLCHGQPVRSDSQLEHYANRPFGKVFKAIDLVGERIRSACASVACPFPEAAIKGSPNISQGKIRRIQSMHSQGYKIKCIADTVGVSTETVRRWVRRTGQTSDTSGCTA